MRQFLIVAWVASLGLAAPSALAQTESPAREGAVPVKVSSELAEAPTDLATVNKKLATIIEQARRARGTQIDSKGMERGMQQNIDQMRRFCSSQYARC